MLDFYLWLGSGGVGGIGGSVSGAWDRSERVG